MAAFGSSKLHTAMWWASILAAWGVLTLGVVSAAQSLWYSPTIVKVQPVVAALRLSAPSNLPSNLQATGPTAAQDNVQVQVDVQESPSTSYFHGAFVLALGLCGAVLARFRSTKPNVLEQLDLMEVMTLASTAGEMSVESVDEDEVAAKAVEAAAADDVEKVNPKDQFWGQTTYYPKLADTLAVNKKWHIIDATDLRLGRMATEIANLLRGKRNPMFHPAMDVGDYVIVINAEKVIVSGRKADKKLYRRHTTGRPGAMKVETFKELQQRIPERIVEHAVKGMLPKGSLGRGLFTHLKVFKGPNHPHDAQKPVEFKIEGRAAEPLGRR